MMYLVDNDALVGILLQKMDGRRSWTEKYNEDKKRKTKANRIPATNPLLLTNPVSTKILVHLGITIKK
jgi:hypothetical protein